MNYVCISVKIEQFNLITSERSHSYELFWSHSMQFKSPPVNLYRCILNAPDHSTEDEEFSSAISLCRIDTWSGRYILSQPVQAFNSAAISLSPSLYPLT